MYTKEVMSYRTMSCHMSPSYLSRFNYFNSLPAFPFSRRNSVSFLALNFPSTLGSLGTSVIIRTGRWIGSSQRGGGEGLTCTTVGVIVVYPLSSPPISRQRRMADQEQQDLLDEDQILGQEESAPSTAEVVTLAPSSDTSAPVVPPILPAESDSRAAASPAPQEESSAEKGKIDVLLKAVGDAPIMKKKRWAVDPNKKIAWIADFVRKYIKCEPHESLFLYVNQYFSPSPDQEIGSIYECFGSDGKLVLRYCKQQAWG